MIIRIVCFYNNYFKKLASFLFCLLNSYYFSSRSILLMSCLFDCAFGSFELINFPLLGNQIWLMIVKCWGSSVDFGETNAIRCFNLCFFIGNEREVCNGLVVNRPWCNLLPFHENIFYISISSIRPLEQLIVLQGRFLNLFGSFSIDSMHDLALSPFIIINHKSSRYDVQRLQK